MGSERFEEFAAQVGRHIDRGIPLMRETIERVAGTRAMGSEDAPPDGWPPAPCQTTANKDLAPHSTMYQRIPLPAGRTAATVAFEAVRAALFTESSAGYDGAAAAPQRPGPSRRAEQATEAPANWLTQIMRVFLPFAAAGYLALLFRTINGLIAAPLAQEFGLGAGDLGLLTSIYFLVFAAAQVPVGILLDRDGPRRIQSVLLLAIAVGAALFASADSFWGLLAGRALIGLGVASALTAGLQALILWFPRERVPFLNGLMMMVAALGAVTATSPADSLLASMGWRGLFDLLAWVAAGCAALIYVVVPAAPEKPVQNQATLASFAKIYADPNFWRLAPLSAASIGTAWSLHGLWAAQWLGDVEGLDRPALVQHLFAMAVAFGLGALSLGILLDRLKRRGVGSEMLLSAVTMIFIAAELALILRWPLSSYLPWVVVAAVGAATVVSFAVLAEYFPKEIAGRANGALNVFHIGGAFVLQYATGVVLQHWTPQGGHYPEIAYQAAFALNVVLQVGAWVWFALPRDLLRPSATPPPRPSES